MPEVVAVAEKVMVKVVMSEIVTVAAKVVCKGSNYIIYLHSFVLCG